MLDGYTAIEADTRPHPGDVSLCAYCGLWLIFDAPAARGKTDDDAKNPTPVILRRPSVAEMADIEAMADYPRLAKLRDMVIAQRKAKRLN